MTFIGLAATVGVGVNKIMNVYNDVPSILITDSPYFYIALVCMIIGTQLFLAGFLGELVSRNSSDRNHYQIDKEI